MACEDSLFGMYLVFDKDLNASCSMDALALVLALFRVASVSVFQDWTDSCSCCCCVVVVAVVLVDCIDSEHRHYHCCSKEIDHVVDHGWRLAYEAT